MRVIPGTPGRYKELVEMVLDQDTIEGRAFQKIVYVQRYLRNVSRDAPVLTPRELAEMIFNKLSIPEIEAGIIEVVDIYAKNCKRYC